ncbi:MAG: phosphoribosylamine--glycine ligase [Trueperaceae bacterium]|nr:phosphoribosylamine--glycine ligase [Trueperaceae bacterium]
MRVMVVGSGGREHAIVLALKKSKRVTEVFCAPGNAGIAQVASCLATDASVSSLLALAKEQAIDLTVVGPEGPLVAGIVDAFEAEGLQIFGPNKKASQLEGSKVFCKSFLERHVIPTAKHQSFKDELLALEYLEKVGVPIVIKDSNLAAGKGVTVATEKEQARSAIENILSAPEGGELVIEDYLPGQEVSFLIFVDGESYAPMLLAQDYKQAFDGDRGDMTGGMGTIAPVSLLSDAQYDYVRREIIEKTLAGLKKDDILYKGVLFIGLMVTESDVKVLEFNCRFGDPETQVVLPLLKTDLLEIMEAVIEGRLAETRLEWSDEAAACIIMAAPGYPGSYKKDIPITVPELAKNVTVIHAGTRLKEGQLVSSGGRVLGVTAVADNLDRAIASAYEAVEDIEFPEAHYRRDIGSRLQKTKN